jgi:hypothetical protein
MRVNVYDHDLTGCVVEAGPKEADEGAIFKGVRFFLNPKIMHGPDDDDTPAVTFWYNQDAAYEKNLLITSLVKALRLLGVTELPPEKDYAEVRFMKMGYTGDSVNPPSPTPDSASESN